VIKNHIELKPNSSAFMAMLIMKLYASTGFLGKSYSMPWGKTKPYFKNNDSSVNLMLVNLKIV